MGFFLIILASIFAAFYNLCMRKSVQYEQNAQGFLMVELWIAGFFSALIHPARLGVLFWTSEVVFAGISVGLVFGSMLYFLGKALEHGPAGLTVAGLNASNVFPAMVLWYFFGPKLGFVYQPQHAAGAFLVVIGIFWASWEVSKQTYCRSWFFYLFFAVFCHVFFFVCMEWRSWMMRYPDSISQFRLLAQTSASNPWFVPSMYLGAAFLHTAIFFYKKGEVFSGSTWWLGSFGGVLNALYAFFLVWSSEKASTLEQGMLYPLFSVMTIFLCNLWGKRLYQEKIHWKACHLAFAGIFLGTVDWETVLLYWQ
ncbi:MAG: hypothetical protein AAGI90_01825 [Chlamydiota bacterium]